MSRTTAMVGAVVLTLAFMVIAGLVMVQRSGANVPAASAQPALITVPSSGVPAGNAPAQLQGDPQVTEADAASAADRSQSVAREHSHDEGNEHGGD